MTIPLGRNAQGVHGPGPATGRVRAADAGSVVADDVVHDVVVDDDVVVHHDMVVMRMTAAGEHQERGDEGRPRSRQTKPLNLHVLPSDMNTSGHIQPASSKSG